MRIQHALELIASLFQISFLSNVLEVTYKQLSLSKGAKRLTKIIKCLPKG